MEASPARSNLLQAHLTPTVGERRILDSNSHRNPVRTALADRVAQTGAGLGCPC
jgi:hypothetical protein